MGVRDQDRLTGCDNVAMGRPRLHQPKNPAGLCLCGCGSATRPSKKARRTDDFNMFTDECRRRRLVEANVRRAKYHHVKGGRMIITEPGTRGRRGTYRYRLVFAHALGRPLATEEQIHHLNGDKLDDRIENLMIFMTPLAHAEYELAHGHYPEAHCYVTPR